MAVVADLVTKLDMSVAIVRCRNDVVWGDRKEYNGSRTLSPHRNTPAATWTHGDKNCTSFLEGLDITIQDPIGADMSMDDITMEGKQDADLYLYHSLNEDQYYIEKSEYIYIGMNKQESRKATGVVEYIYLSGYFMIKVIVQYQKVIIFCFNSKEVSPTSIYLQYKDLFILEKDTLCDIPNLILEEEVHCLSVHICILIMYLSKMIQYSYDCRLHSNIINKILGSYITPIMRYTLRRLHETHQIIDALSLKAETLEEHLKRITNTYNKTFSTKEKDKIQKYEKDEKYDISFCSILIIKIVDYSLQHDPKIKSNSNKTNDYEGIKDICKKIKDIRNFICHNFPEEDDIKYLKYLESLKDLEKLVYELVDLIKQHLFTPDINKLTKHMKLQFKLAYYYPFNYLESFESALLIFISYQYLKFLLL